MKLLESLRAVSPKKWWIIGISAGCALLVLLGCLFLLPGGTPAGGKVNPGEKATITVTTFNKKKATCTVTVENPVA